MKARKGEKFTSKPGKGNGSMDNLSRGLSSSEKFDPGSHAPSCDNPAQITQQHKDHSAPNGTKIRGV